MLVVIGFIVVAFSVFGGFVMAGGHLASLLQPIELLMIGGAAAGALVAGNTIKALKATGAAVPTLFQGSKYNKELYLDLLLVLYAIFTKIRNEGMKNIEEDVEEPEKSKIFMRYPKILASHHHVEFICDYLRLMVSGTMDPFQIENLMDVEIETHHHEGEVPVHVFAKMADAMPAFGIVAAVMGVVHTMASVGLPPAELGILIAHALVGTFLGILLSYGFVAPLANLLESKLHDSTKSFEWMKIAILANMNGFPPAVAVEFGRKVLYSTERPGFKELEDQIKATKVDYAEKPKEAAKAAA
jgi:chemotaxis protein MotA